MRSLSRRLFHEWTIGNQKRHHGQLLPYFIYDCIRFIVYLYIFRDVNKAKSKSILDLVLIEDEKKKELNCLNFYKSINKYVVI